jgi:hypothetical protein
MVSDEIAGDTPAATEMSNVEASTHCCSGVCVKRRTPNVQRPTLKSVAAAFAATNAELLK